MRLIDAYAFAKDCGNSPEVITSDLRVRLVPYRPSALEARGEPPLCEVGSLVYGKSDWGRFHPQQHLLELQFRRERELEQASHSAPSDFCRRCEFLDVDTRDADALARVLGEGRV